MKIKNEDTMPEYPERELSEYEYKKVDELFQATKNEEAFSIDGVTFLGNRAHVIKQYIIQNPSDKFYIWCDKHLKRVNG